MKRLACILLFYPLILSSCATAPSEATIALSPTNIQSTKLTKTPDPTETPKPSPTLDPWSDPDADGYPIYYEQQWGSDPFTFTSFEDLAKLPGSIYAKMKVSQPFEFADMNETFYQVARSIEIEDGGTPDYSGDDHLIFEVVLFPYVEDNPTPVEVDLFPIDPGVYPTEVQPYLISYEDDIANITPEIKETMLAIVNGTGEGYSSPAKTDLEAIERIMSWNWSNLAVDPKYETYYPPYGSIVKVRSGDMFEDRLTRWSTSRAVILNAELRSVGIPSKIYFHISCICNPNDDYENCDNRGTHPENGAYVGGRWVVFDYKGVHPRSAPHGTNLVITDSFRDNSEADFNFWIYIVDTPRIEYPFNLLYYTYERVGN